MAARPIAGRPHVAGQVLKSGRVTKRKTEGNKVLSDQIEAASTDQVLEQVHGEPPAWAENCQQLCDAIPWFHCTQGVMDHNGRLCWGFLIDADGGTRTYIDEEVIITRIGGCCTKDSEGDLALQKNQKADSTLARSIIASLNSKLPVGLIIGSKHKILNRDLPHRYNVMAWFRVTNVWFERIGMNHGAKVRFEKLDLAEKSWWAAKGSAPPMLLELRDFDTKPEVRGLLQGNRPDDEIRPNCSLVPDHLSTLDEDATDISTSRGAWKGIVCPECHKCIRRTLWRGWKCIDDSGAERGGKVCSFERLMTMKPISCRVVYDDSERPSMKREMVFDKKFMIPEIDDKLDGVGFITHFVANAEINSRPNGPDDLFIGLQREDLGLKRFPLSSSLVQALQWKYSTGGHRRWQICLLSALQDNSVLKGCQLEDQCRVLKEKCKAGEISQDKDDNSRRTLFATQKGK
ncbi:Oxoglutarate/iron-dependent dioxygenase [Penicillium bovifimosum]|uniref:Oxoglutarate/iron-dependent dioxygenase n=1 Tax=Penicillium bovifimosum TaxID=126998 RepID=A0A9W9LBG0_9EURO|nr:Oxoglutarate/iron-dependent dioxygenase [Penicillium bovifimosum]KAJ5145748.1 Oxoglutarate/iron-dependent dioxygenase [Penicillium bovifimosum]